MAIRLFHFWAKIKALWLQKLNLMASYLLLAIIRCASPAFLHALAVMSSRLRLWAGGRQKEQLWLFANLEHIWGLKRGTSFAKLFAQQVYYHQSIVMLETIKEILCPGSLHWQGLEELAQHMQRAEEAGLGQILITAHLGSWELVGKQAASCTVKPFYALAKPARSPALGAVLAMLRQKMGLKVLWTGQKVLQRQMLAALKEGAWLGFVMDQKPMGRQGPLVHFWQRPTEFVGGPAQMAIRERRPVISAFCVRTGPQTYRILSKLLVAPHHPYEDPQELTQLMASEIERVIRLYPEQWCWNYKRWRF